MMDNFAELGFKAIKDSEDTINNTVQQQQMLIGRAQAYAMLSVSNRLMNITNILDSMDTHLDGLQECLDMISSQLAEK